MAAVFVVCLLVFGFGMLFYNSFRSVYAWTDHYGWEDNSTPDKNAKIKNITSEKVQYGSSSTYAKLKTKITFSDGFYFITHKTDYNHLGIYTYQVYLSDELREKIVSLAIEKHNLAVDKFIQDNQSVSCEVQEFDEKTANEYIPNSKNTNVKDLIEQAQSVLQEFYALVLASPANLRGELDTDFIDGIINTCKDKLESPEYKQFYAVVEKYGSVKLQMYDWLGGMLATMYTVKTDITKKEINTLDWMLIVVNANLKRLGSETFFSKDKPTGTTEYPIWKK